MGRLPSLLAAGAGVAAVRVLLWLLPYRTVRALIERASRPRPRATRAPGAAERIARDVARVARRLPGATCLVQALAAEWLIGRAGGAATLRLGVARGDAGLEAHAWLESGGRVILGAADVPRFSPLGSGGGPSEGA